MGLANDHLITERGPGSLSARDAVSRNIRAFRFPAGNAAGHLPNDSTLAGTTLMSRHVLSALSSILRQSSLLARFARGIADGGPKLLVQALNKNSNINKGVTQCLAGF